MKYLTFVFMALVCSSVALAQSPNTSTTSAEAEVKSAIKGEGLTIGVGYNAASKVTFRDIATVVPAGTNFKGDPLTSTQRADLNVESEPAPSVILGYDSALPYSFAYQIHTAYEAPRKFGNADAKISLLDISANIGYRFRSIAPLIGLNYNSVNMKNNTGYTIEGDAGAQAGFSVYTSIGVAIDMQYRVQRLVYKDNNNDNKGEFAGVVVQSRYVF